MDWSVFSRQLREAIPRATEPEITHSAMPRVVTIHGSEDEVVPLEQAFRLRRVLDTLGVANRLGTLDASGHLFEDQRQLGMAVTRLFRFLQRLALNSAEQR